MKQEDLYRILTRIQEYLSQKKYAFIIPEHLLLAIIQEPRFKEIAIYCKSDMFMTLFQMTNLNGCVLEQMEKRQLLL